MSTPLALLHLPDPRYKDIIAALSLEQNFSVLYSQSASWLEDMRNSPDIAIVDGNNFSQADYQQLEVLKFCPETDIIFLSEGLPNPILDKTVLKCAAFHYRTPIEAEHIHELIEDLLEEYQSYTGKKHTIKTSELDQFGLLFGSSKVMKKLYRNIRKVAAFDTSVLIVGESGVGKELVAHTVHNASERAEQPFVAVNCGALNKELASSDLFGHTKGAFTGAHSAREGYFTQAKNGTLFLDEVTEMPEDLQVQLLRVLETGDYSPVGSNTVLHSNVRIIAATNRDLAEAVSEGIFREDLYFRLAQFLLHIPPLRSRGDDIQGLAKHFLAYKNAEAKLGKQISEEALATIQKHQWPGNVRELKYTIERAYILALDVIGDEHIVFGAAGDEQSNSVDVPAGVPLAELEKQAILNTLEQQQGNKSDTAKVLDISVKTLYNKLEKYGDIEDTP